MSVWVEGWQMQCCGKPFEVGSRVAWTLVPVDADFLGHMLGAGSSGTIDAAEEHHGGVPDDTPETAGTVRAIRAVQCRYAPVPGGDERMLAPVAASAVQTDVQAADGWLTDGDGLQFVGYLVRLAV
jgi:hypothetical protein